MTYPSVNRRGVLQFLGLAAAGATLPAGQAVSGEDDQTYALYQDGECIEIEPLWGTEPAEDFYAYAYPMDEYYGTLGIDGTSFSSEGTVELQRDNTSLLFLYKGPDGLSLFVVHGHLDGEDDDGGTVSFTIDGLPEDGEWIVRDDYRLDEDGNEVSTDNWDVEKSPHVIDWMYQSGRTDGGVFWPLCEAFEFRIEPTFNEAAYFGDEYERGPITQWEVLSGNLDDPDRYALQLDRAVIIRQGSCEETDEDSVCEKDQISQKEKPKKPTKEKPTKEKPKKEKPKKEKPKKEKPKKEIPKKEKKEKPKKEKPKKEEKSKKEKPKKEKKEKPKKEKKDS